MRMIRLKNHVKQLTQMQDLDNYFAVIDPSGNRLCFL